MFLAVLCGWGFEIACYLIFCRGVGGVFVGYVVVFLFVTSLLIRVMGVVRG